jgi:hypothetical protein
MGQERDQNSGGLYYFVWKREFESSDMDRVFCQKGD